MKQAIDRYALGKEKEVNADDFDGLWHIPDRLNRFFCPECGEVVFFRAKGGNKPSHFFHQEKNDKTPECDRRVDGRSALSLSERIGLPIFLTNYGHGDYYLSIGFPALGEKLLDAAAAKGCIVEISCGDRHKQLRIDHTLFIEDSITMIPIDFIPKNGKNFSIDLLGKESVVGIQRKWSDYADGFESGGAIFSYDEPGGKKIRRDDCVSVGRSYYVVSKKRMPSYEGITVMGKGSIELNREYYNVYRMDITVSSDDAVNFSRVSSFLHSYFGVWLLECQPELIPIWPPVVQREHYVPIMNRSSVICAVSSGNETPIVYVYSENGVQERKSDYELNGIHIVEVGVGERPIVLSVDRKYVGREMTLVKDSYTETRQDYAIGLIGTAGNRIVEKKVERKQLGLQFEALVNGKMELYVETNGKLYRHFSLRESLTAIKIDAKIMKLLFVVESMVIFQVDCFEASKIKNGTWRQMWPELNKGKEGMVPIPRWVDCCLRRIKSSQEEELFDLVISRIDHGFISTNILELLRKEYNK